MLQLQEFFDCHNLKCCRILEQRNIIAGTDIVKRALPWMAPLKD